MKSVGLLLTGILLLLCGSVYAERTLWYVHPDSSLNTIQAGLDSCADNDIVLVGPGTYYENIIWPNTQGIHLVSELGPGATIIDGDSGGGTIELATRVDTTTIISGFTFQNVSSDIDSGGIINCLNSSPMIINNVISNNDIGNHTNWCGGIVCVSGSPIIMGNTIIHNTYHPAPGGEGSGGICCFESSPLIMDNTITHQIVCGWFYQIDGGGIYCSNSSPTIMANTITDNYIHGGNGAYGGGILCTGSSSATITDNMIANNTLQGYITDGGGICLNDSSSATITGNTITTNDRNGILCHDNYEASVIITDCVIADNSDHGVWCRPHSSLVIHYCDITGNTGYGVLNQNAVVVDATHNWWGDATGPYHHTLNPGGLGDSVSDYVDFIPWLYWPGVEEKPAINPVIKHNTVGATIFSGPLILPKGKNCKVFDITGRVVALDKMKPGIYFLEIDSEVVQKVIKVK